MVCTFSDHAELIKAGKERCGECKETLWAAPSGRCNHDVFSPKYCSLCRCHHTASKAIPAKVVARPVDVVCVEEHESNESEEIESERPEESGIEEEQHEEYEEQDT